MVSGSAPPVAASGLVTASRPGGRSSAVVSAAACDPARDARPHAVRRVDVAPPGGQPRALDAVAEADLDGVVLGQTRGEDPLAGRVPEELGHLLPAHAVDEHGEAAVEPAGAGAGDERQRGAP